MDSLPGLKRGIAGGHFGIKISIGEIEIPISVLDVTRKISNSQLKISQSHVRINSCNGDAIDDTWLAIRASQAVVLKAASFEQGLANFRVEPGRVGARKCITWRIVGVVLC